MRTKYYLFEIITHKFYKRNKQTQPEKGNTYTYVQTRNGECKRVKREERKKEKVNEQMNERSRSEKPTKLYTVIFEIKLNTYVSAFSDKFVVCFLYMLWAAVVCFFPYALQHFWRA